MAREAVMSPEHRKFSHYKPWVVSLPNLAVSHVSALCQELRSVTSTSLTYSLPVTDLPLQATAYTLVPFFFQRAAI